jgi:uncharacterized protein
MEVIMRLILLILGLLAAPVSAAPDEKAFLAAVSELDAKAVHAMLAEDPSLARATRPNGTSAVTAALFAIPNGETFHDATTNEVLKEILAQKPPLDAFETAALGSAEQVETILRKDPDAIRKRSRFGWTMLHMAAFAGNLPVTDLLIRNGAAIEVRAESRFRNTPLQTAMLAGQYATAKLLLEHGADPLVRQSKGFTPMHEAALLGRTDLLELLLAHGAEINSMSDSGITPLAEAIRGNHEAAVAWMRAKGAKVEATPDEAEKPKK